MFNQNPMAMPMMQFQVQNQNEMKREEIIKPYKEIIKQLEKENERLINENNQLKNQLKQYQMNNMGNQMNLMNNMGNMGMINNQNNMMNQMNNMGNIGMINNQNNMMNQMNPMNNMGNMGMINNQFNQFNMMNPMNNNIMNSPMYQMCNQMNFVGNQMIPMMDNIKYLSIRVKMEDGHQIFVQTKSDDKIEKAINNFCTKVLIRKKDDYDFFVVKELNAKFNSTVEEIGINGNDDYILAKKKIIRNKNDNLNENNIRINEVKKIKKNKNLINPNIKGTHINLIFNKNNTSLVSVDVGTLNTLKEAIILYYSKTNDEQNKMFLFNGNQLNPNDNRTLDQIKIRSGNRITVLNKNEVYGA